MQFYILSVWKCDSLNVWKCDMNAQNIQDIYICFITRTNTFVLKILKLTFEYTT